MMTLRSSMIIGMNLLGLLAGSAVVQGFASLPFFGGSARLSTNSLVKNGPVAFTKNKTRRLEALNLYDSSSSSYESEDFSDENHRSSSSGVFDLKELTQRISKQSMEDLFLAPDGSLMVKPEDVHIILFNPNTDEEGAHTIESPKGSGNNILLAFESENECIEFAFILKQQQFFDPVPQQMNLEQLEAYCETLGVPVQIIPDGTSIRPPTENVEELNYNPSLKEETRRLNYLFENMEAAEDTVLPPDLGAWD
mmetsp:Transcript_7305/g.13106  ORF Transcript_7305/g.13106 Transcript_7305/m.13106 type:complete len:252 (-) Transcript_7305:334-1089(-)